MASSAAKPHMNKSVSITIAHGKESSTQVVDKLLLNGSITGVPMKIVHTGLGSRLHQRSEKKQIV